MKRFILCFLLIVGFMPYVLAQNTTRSNFNFVVEDDEEFQSTEDVADQAIEEPKEAEPDEVKEKAAPQEVKSEQKAQPQNVPPTNEKAPSPDTEENEEDEEEEKDDEKIFMALNDIKGTIAAVRSVSYCSGYLVMFNNLKKNVKEISGTIGIGNQTKDFKFTNVNAGVSIGWPIQIVGNACESMLALPDLKIKKCQVEGISDKKCRSKLIYIPLGAK